MTVVGTRPEAIKLAPLLRVLQRSQDFESRLCVTGQHRHLLDQALALFGLRPDCDLNLMALGQDPLEVTDRVAAAVVGEIRQVAPDWILVQGDTASALGAARAAADAGIPLAHIEAGLRSGNPWSPWPEELNRQEISTLANLHFAPTPLAAAALLLEGVSPDRIALTGNPVIDSLKWMECRLDSDPALSALLRRRFGFLDPARCMILATVHRRERRQRRLEIFTQIVTTLAKREDVEIVTPLHPSPEIAEPLMRRIGGRARIHSIAPPDYAGCVYLLRRAALVLTDSGGLQEEAPALGKPVLILRDCTERPEAIHAGAARLVGLSSSRAVVEANALLDKPERYAMMARPRQIFGDGFAGERIAMELHRVAAEAGPKSRRPARQSL